MEFFPLVIGGWAIGMVIYSILNIANKKHIYRCDCSNEIMKIKKAQQRLNDTIRKS